ncbi:Crossover junction endonuclease EME1B [Coccomyxa sp. Obi]|nr:Crossover junction endonuclease EME1B [Coccomyxa sp. Obi]
MSSDDDEELLRDIGLRDPVARNVQKPPQQFDDELFDLTASPTGPKPPLITPKHSVPQFEAQLPTGTEAIDTEVQGGASGRARRKRQRPQYLASYDEGQIFDASQHDDSQQDVAKVPEPQIPSGTAQVTRPAPYIPALAPEVASTPEQEIPPPPQRRRAQGKTAEERAEVAAAKEREKQEKKAAKERTKQEKAAQKEQEKRQKAQERLDRQRDNGKKALEDIRTVLCPAAMSHATTLKVMERLIADEFKYEVNIGGPLPLGAAAGSVPTLRSILWKRRIYPRRSDAEESQVSQGVDGDTEPEVFQDIPYVLLHMTGEELVTWLEKDTLDNLLARVAAAHAGYTLGLLIEGLHSYLKRRENADYRRLGPGGGGFNSTGYEEMLARLIVDQPGVHHRCVADAAAAADHISYLTKALAQQPYKAQEAFLSQFGGSGKGTKDRYATLARYPLQHRAREPWYHALSYVVDIGPTQAHPIVNQHPSLGQLMAIYADPTRSQREKENLVADLRYVGGDNRRVGPAASKRLFALFTATDPLMPLGDLGFTG